MKKIIYILIFLAVSLGTVNFGEQLKQTIKFVSITIFERVENWSFYKDGPQNFTAITEEYLLIKDTSVAYTDSLVYKYGQVIKLNLIGNGQFGISASKITNNGDRIVIIEEFVEEVKTASFAVYSSFHGVVSDSHQITINTGVLGSGWSSINVKNPDGDMIFIPVFVDPYKTEKNILFVAGTDTLLAYNPRFDKFKIPNFYSKNLDKSESGLVPQNTPIVYEQLSYDRINEINCKDHLLNSDMVHKRNLTKLNINFQSVSDEMLDDPDTLRDVDLVIFGAHNEYWTEEKAINAMNFVDSGGKVLLLGGNQAYRQIYRDAKRTWIHGAGLTKNKIFNKLISKYLGTNYTNLDFDTYSNLKVANSEAILENFSIKLEPNFSLGTGTKFSHCSDKIFGVSGHETDKLTLNSEGFLLLAKGQNDAGGADVVLKNFPSGGKILNFSSISFWHNNDVNLTKMIKNFIEFDESK